MSHLIAGWAASVFVGILRKVASSVAAALVAAAVVAALARGEASEAPGAWDVGPWPVRPAPDSGHVAQPFPRSSPPAVVRPVLRQHDPAPGLPEGFGIYFTGTVRIDAAGDTLIWAYLEGPDVTEGNGQVIYWVSRGVGGAAGEALPVLRQGQPAPEFGEDVIISDLLGADEGLAQNGLIVAISEVRGPGIVPGYNDRVLYAGYPGSLRRALQGGDQAIGCEPGVYVDPNSAYFHCAVSNNGTLRVEAKLAGAGVSSLNDSAVWVGPVDELALVYREGMQAPGCSAGVTFAYADLFVHNDLGQVAFRGGLRGAGVTSANDQGLWFGSAVELVKLAREGDQVSGLPAGVTWKSAGGPDDMDSGGRTTGTYYIQGPGVTAANDRVFYVWAPEGPSLVARKGSPAAEAGPGVTLEPSTNSLISNTGEVLWRVKYSGARICAANQWAMYSGLPTDPRETLRDSGPAPTLGLGATLRQTGAMPTLAAMNVIGDLAAPTQIRGSGVGDADKVVLWMRHHVLQRWVPLLRSGMEIDGRTLYAEDETAFGCGATGGSDGRHRTLNDSAELAMRLEFTDGTHGIYRVSFPFGDGNRDGQIDLADLSWMQFCWSGVDNSLERDGAAFDMDADGDVDLADLAAFQQLCSGG